MDAASIEEVIVYYRETGRALAQAIDLLAAQEAEEDRVALVDAASEWYGSTIDEWLQDQLDSIASEYEDDEEIEREERMQAVRDLAEVARRLQGIAQGVEAGAERVGVDPVDFYELLGTVTTRSDAKARTAEWLRAPQLALKIRKMIDETSAGDDDVEETIRALVFD